MAERIHWWAVRWLERRAIYLSIYLSIDRSIYPSIYLQNDILMSNRAPTPFNLFTRLTWKCASRHDGVHFFNISASKSGPNMWCFYVLLSGATNHWENSVLQLSYRFAHLHLLSSDIFWLCLLWSAFFWLSLLWSDFFFPSPLWLSLLTLPISAFHLSILSEVWLLRFLSFLR